MYAYNDKGQQYHVELAKGDVGRYVILPGDPGRVETIAAFLDHPVKMASHREYVTYTGALDGVKVSVTSTGIGGPSAAIAVEELIAAGADTFIRIGTAGMIQDYFNLNDCIIATGAVRDEGTTRQYIPLAYPAVAHYQVVAALQYAAEKCGKVSHIGIVQSKDAFYGEAEPESMPNEDMLRSQWKAWKRGQVLASEMEAAALFVVSSIRKARAGCVLNNRGDMKETIAVAVEAVRYLIGADRK
ncbi:MAG: uridine phosphorylase [Lachnospiraceae bacterium]|jgi:uridine phosphorylase|nr:uridine phosphorylase [Lachnospiraceae bacterium]